MVDRREDRRTQANQNPLGLTGSLASAYDFMDEAIYNALRVTDNTKGGGVEGILDWIDEQRARDQERKRRRNNPGAPFVGPRQVEEARFAGSGVDGPTVPTIPEPWDYLGVPENFLPIRRPRIRSGSYTTADALERRSQPMTMGRIDENGNVVAPMYRQNDEYTQLQSLPPESLRRVQEQMIRAGFDLEADGMLTGATADALAATMSYANMNGLNWKEGLNDLERQATASREDLHASARSDWARIQREYMRDPYLAPSYETMAQSTKSLFRQRLGREPKDYEIELLSEELATSARAAFNQEQDIDQQMALRQAALDINSQFDEGDEPIAVPGAPSDGVAVDPAANFRQKFDELYQPEMDAEKAEVDHADTTARLFSGIAGLNQRMMG